MDALTGLSGGGRSSLIMSVYLTSDQSPLLWRYSECCEISQASAGPGEVWGDWDQTKPNHQSLALVTANLSYVELGQSAQVRGSDAACPFLSEMFTFVKTITENDAYYIFNFKWRLFNSH